MGAVYLAEHTELGHEVVIKLLHERVAQDRDMIDRVRLEAQTLAGIFADDHRNELRRKGAYLGRVVVRESESISPPIQPLRIYPKLPRRSDPRQSTCRPVVDGFATKSLRPSSLPAQSRRQPLQLLIRHRGLPLVAPSLAPEADARGNSSAGSGYRRADRYS